MTRENSEKVATLDKLLEKGEPEKDKAKTADKDKTADKALQAKQGIFGKKLAEKFPKVFGKKEKAEKEEDKDLIKEYGKKDKSSNKSSDGEVTEYHDKKTVGQKIKAALTYDVPVKNPFKSHRPVNASKEALNGAKKEVASLHETVNKLHLGDKKRYGHEYVNEKLDHVVEKLENLNGTYKEKGEMPYNPFTMDKAANSTGVDLRDASKIVIYDYSDKDERGNPSEAVCYVIGKDGKPLTTEINGKSVPVVFQMVYDEKGNLSTPPKGANLQRISVPVYATKDTPAMMPIYENGKPIAELVSQQGKDTRENLVAPKITSKDAKTEGTFTKNVVDRRTNSLSNFNKKDTDQMRLD
jgi:hypothetical protein